MNTFESAASEEAWFWKSTQLIRSRRVIDLTRPGWGGFRYNRVSKKVYKIAGSISRVQLVKIEISESS